MPKLKVNGAELYYEDSGGGKETIVFSHGLLWSCRMFDQSIMFSQSFLNNPARAAEREHWQQHLIRNHRIGITRAVKGVITRKAVYDELDKIKCPTLIIVGDEDVATVPAKSERIQAKIAGSKLVRIPRAGHSSSVEEPEAVNQAIMDFLSTVRV